VSAKNGVSLTRNKNCFSPTGTTPASVAASSAPNLVATAMDDEHLFAPIAFIENGLAGLERSRPGAGVRQQAEINRCVRHVPPPTFRWRAPK
jgi:hypothetical protein